MKLSLVFGSSWKLAWCESSGCHTMLFHLLEILQLNEIIYLKKFHWISACISDTFSSVVWTVGNGAWCWTGEIWPWIKSEPWCTHLFEGSFLGWGRGGDRRGERQRFYNQGWLPICNPPYAIPTICPTTLWLSEGSSSSVQILDFTKVSQMSIN